MSAYTTVICALFELALRTGQPQDLNRLYRIPPPLLRQIVASSREFQRTAHRAFVEIDERLAATARDHAAGAATGGASHTPGAIRDQLAGAPDPTKA